MGCLKLTDEKFMNPLTVVHKRTDNFLFLGQEQKQGSPNFCVSDYHYKYNGKEFQDELGLNMYDMDMRQYDPAIARWVVQDPVVHFDYSPYSAFDNNPVFWADPSGADAKSLIDDILEKSDKNKDTHWVNNNDGTFSGSNGESVDCDDCKLKGGEFDSKSFDEIKIGQLDKWYQPMSFNRTKSKLTQEDVDDYLESTIITLEETSKNLKFYAALLGVSPASLIKKAGSIRNIKLIDLLKLEKFNLASASAFVMGANLYMQGMKLDQVRAQMRVIDNDNSFEKAKSIYIISEIRIIYGLNGANTTNSYFYYNADNQKFIGSTFDFY